MQTACAGSCEALLQAPLQYRMTLSEIIGYVATTYDNCQHCGSQIDGNIRYYLSTDGMLAMKRRAGFLHVYKSERKCCVPDV